MGRFSCSRLLYDSVTCHLQLLIVFEYRNRTCSATAQLLEEPAAALVVENVEFVFNSILVLAKTRMNLAKYMITSSFILAP